MTRSKSSRAWLAEHFTDEYVKRARQQGYRSRAVFKLREIDERDHLLKPGMFVVDLGAAPGGWSQYAVERVGPRGRVLALDCLPIDPFPGVEIIQADFTADTTLDALQAQSAGRPIDLVISDMAPNISGIDVSDQARAMYLAELAFDFARRHLRPGGTLLVKTFQGQGFNEFFRELKANFDKVSVRKPKASRTRSRETYLLAKGLHSVPPEQPESE